jgi:hypothetical protein
VIGYSVAGTMIAQADARITRIEVTQNDARLRAVARFAIRKCLMNW